MAVIMMMIMMIMMQVDETKMIELLMKITMIITTTIMDFQNQGSFREFRFFPSGFVWIEN